VGGNGLVHAMTKKREFPLSSWSFVRSTLWIGDVKGEKEKEDGVESSGQENKPDLFIHAPQ